MRISIITAVYNNEHTLSYAIDSVFCQKFVDIEYVVIDGGSSDKTVDIIRSYRNKISKFISEPDKGIYDAMNKGIELASGDIIGILNSDDMYANDTVLHDVVETFEQTGADVVYGDLVYVSKEDPDKVMRYWKSGPYKLGSFLKGWHPAHPAFFVRKEIYDKYGIFDLSFDISADFELMLRLFEKYKVKSTYLPKVLVKMRLGGESNRSLSNIVKGNLNILRAFRKNGIFVTPMYTIKRAITKMKQYLMNR